MLNTEISVYNQSNTQTINNNEASTGQLVKMSKTSKLARFQKGSEMEKQFFCDKPYVTKRRIEWNDNVNGPLQYYETDDYYDIDILQVIVFGDNQYLVEYEIGEKRY